MAQSFEKIVYFVRHGQSEGNLGLVFQGPESPLSDKGLNQAKQVAFRASKLDFDTLIASPYARARQTAEAIAESTGKEIVISDLFIERRRPSNSAEKSRDDAQAIALEELWFDSLYNSDLRAEDGENYDDLIARADQALVYLANLTSSKIVVVTHGYFLQTLLARIMLGENLDPQSLKSFIGHSWHENTGITAIVSNLKQYKPGWSLWIYNDHAHLAE